MNFKTVLSLKIKSLKVFDSFKCIAVLNLKAVLN